MTDAFSPQHGIYLRTRAFANPAKDGFEYIEAYEEAKAVVTKRNRTISEEASTPEKKEEKPKSSRLKRILTLNWGSRDDEDFDNEEDINLTRKSDPNNSWAVRRIKIGFNHDYSGLTAGEPFMKVQSLDAGLPFIEALQGLSHFEGYATYDATDLISLETVEELGVEHYKGFVEREGMADGTGIIFDVGDNPVEVLDGVAKDDGIYSLKQLLDHYKKARAKPIDREKTEPVDAQNHLLNSILVRLHTSNNLQVLYNSQIELSKHREVYEAMNYARRAFQRLIDYTNFMRDPGERDYLLDKHNYKQLKIDDIYRDLSLLDSDALNYLKNFIGGSNSQELRDLFNVESNADAVKLIDAGLQATKVHNQERLDPDQVVLQFQKELEALKTDLQEQNKHDALDDPKKDSFHHALFLAAAKIMQRVKNEIDESTAASELEREAFRDYVADLARKLDLAFIILKAQAYMATVRQITARFGEEANKIHEYQKLNEILDRGFDTIRDALKKMGADDGQIAEVTDQIMSADHASMPTLLTTVLDIYKNQIELWEEASDLKAERLAAEKQAMQHVDMPLFNSAQEDWVTEHKEALIAQGKAAAKEDEFLDIPEYVYSPRDLPYHELFNPVRRRSDTQDNRGGALTSGEREQIKANAKAAIAQSNETPDVIRPTRYSDLPLNPVLGRMLLSGKIGNADDYNPEKVRIAKPDNLPLGPSLSF